MSQTNLVISTTTQEDNQELPPSETPVLPVVPAPAAKPAAAKVKKPRAPTLKPTYKRFMALAVWLIHQFKENGIIDDDDETFQNAINLLCVFKNLDEQNNFYNDFDLKKNQQIIKVMISDKKKIENEAKKLAEKERKLEEKKAKQLAEKERKLAEKLANPNAPPPKTRGGRAKKTPVVADNQHDRISQMVLAPPEPSIPEPVAPEPVAEPVAPEPVLVAPEPVLVPPEPEPVVVAPEPSPPEPVAPEPVVVADAKKTKKPRTTKKNTPAPAPPAPPAQEPALVTAPAPPAQEPAKKTKKTPAKKNIPPPPPPPPPVEEKEEEEGEVADDDDDEEEVAVSVSKFTYENTLYLIDKSSGTIYDYHSQEEIGSLVDGHIQFLK